MDKRSGLTFIELLVIMGIVALMLALMLPALLSVREVSRNITCQNNLKQNGLALELFHKARGRLPSGWTANDASEKPGWAWSIALLPFLEEDALQGAFKSAQAIDDPAVESARQTPISVYMCPSDPTPPLFLLSASPAFEVARSNYAAVFGTLSIEDVPNNGDGVFFRNSQVSYSKITDGLGHTIFLGERSTRLDGTTWLGVLADAPQAMERVVGVTDHVPNDVLGQLADFSSYHVAGANFLMGDTSVRMISDEIDPKVYRALATRAGMASGVDEGSPGDNGDGGSGGGGAGSGGSGGSGGGGAGSGGSGGSGGGGDGSGGGGDSGGGGGGSDGGGDSGGGGGGSGGGGDSGGGGGSDH